MYTVFETVLKKAFSEKKSFQKQNPDQVKKAYPNLYNHINYIEKY